MENKDRKLGAKRPVFSCLQPPSFRGFLSVICCSQQPSRFVFVQFALMFNHAAFAFVDLDCMVSIVINFILLTKIFQLY